MINKFKGALKMSLHFGKFFDISSPNKHNNEMKKILFLLILFSLNVFAQVVSSGNPQAMKATTGVGLHKNRIWWVNWDINNDKLPWDNLINSGGTTTTFVSPAGYTYNITISNVKVFNRTETEVTSGINQVLNSSKTTSWFGNNMPTAYAGFPTEDLIALNQKNETNAAGDGNRVTFRLTVTAVDPYGVSGNATGIVIGGSESLAGTNEWYTLTTPTGRIRLIDKYIKDNNWANYAVQLQVSNGGKTIKATNHLGGDSRGDVILFAEDVPYIDCEVKGSGGQSISIGFLEELDYSDAPASYGRAFHIFENKFSGGLFSNGNNNLTTVSNSADFTSPTGQLAKIGDPTLRLGADIDSEDAPTLPAAGANPNADDLLGADDEDALPATVSNVNGFFSINYVNISPLTSYLSLWIDKNRNGIFDDNEKVSTTIPPNKTGRAILDISSLAIPTGNNYYARIRYSSRANLGPTGFAPDGEVEDHFINVVNTTYNILGTVFQDNNSGTPDGIPLDNITVELLNNSGAVIASTATNYDGAYIFSGLANGAYRVRVILPTTPTYQHVSSTDATPTDGNTIVNVANANRLNVNFGLYFDKCFKSAPVTSGGLPTNHGITALSRAGDNGDGNTTNDWPMVRKGAWTALEAKTKGFVINRVAANYEPPLDDGQVPTITNPVKGMMIYDTTNKCLKIYTGTTWKCFNVQTCPVVN